MGLFADMGMHNALLAGGLVLAVIAAVWIVHKIVKFVLSLVIVAIVVAVVIVYCIKVGYISQEDVAKLNPFDSRQIREAVKDAETWVGEQAQDAAKKAVTEALDHAMPANGRLP